MKLLTKEDMEDILGKQLGGSVYNYARQNMTTNRVMSRKSWAKIAAYNLSNLIQLLEKEYANPPSNKRWAKTMWRTNFDEVITKLKAAK